MSSKVTDLSEEEMGKVAGGTALPAITATVFFVTTAVMTVMKTKNEGEE